MAARRTLLHVALLLRAAAYLPPRTKMSRTATRRQNAWPEKPPAHRDAPRDARDDEWAALLQEARASDPRLAGRPAPRVERFTYAVDGADDRMIQFCRQRRQVVEVTHKTRRAGVACHSVWYCGVRVRQGAIEPGYQYMGRGAQVGR